MPISSDDVIVVSSHLAGENPVRSASYPVHGVECRGEFSYCQGLAEAWRTDKTIVNVEHDMEYTDELVAGLVDCPHPACAYPYLVYPTSLQRYIYCATTTSVPEAEYAEWRQHRIRVNAEKLAGRAADEGQLLVESPRAMRSDEDESADLDRFGTDVKARWAEPGDEWAEWASIGFCKVAPEVRSLPLDRIFWQWLEHSVNRSVSSAGTRWHLHWPAANHLHDYEVVPDHLW